MLSYAMLYNMLCSVIIILRYRTCNVSVMLCNTLFYVTLYNMLCLCYITCYVCYVI